MRAFRTLCGLVTVALLLAGCAGAGGGAGSPQRLNTLVVAYNNEVTTLDPARSDYLQVDMVDQVLYDTLVGYSRGDVVPRLATTYAFAPDVTSLQLTLRPGASFHSGNPVTAADVVYSLDRCKAIGQGIVGQIASYDSATATDDTHVTIKLSRPDALFLGALSRIYILDSTLLRAHTGSDDGQGWLLTHDAGSGPYRFGSSSAGTIQVTRDDRYWQFDPKRPATMIFRRIDDRATTRDELTAGNVDLGQIPVRDATAFAGSRTVVATPAPDANQLVLYFNTAKGAAANPAVRRALRAAFDYQGALASIYNGNGTVASGPLPTNLTCRPDLPTATQNLAQARQILAGAGLAGTTLTLRYQPVYSEQVQAATLLQSNLKQIGVTLVLAPMAFADYLTTLSDFSTIPDMFLLVENPSIPDPGVMVTKNFWSRAVGTNRAAYANPQVDALIARATSTPEAPTRCDLYARAQRLIDADAASMPMVTIHDEYAHRIDIGGTDVQAPAGGISTWALTVGNHPGT
jgi:peptide/nickel transport system substrate-binding protein